ncbi:MAG: tyrosine-type recombinase/integrase [Thiobacillaceae bacterium]
MASITDKGIAKAARDAKSSGTDVWLTDASKARGVGRLRLRASESGQIAFYFRYSNSAGKRDSIVLGSYDIKGAAGLTLKAARTKAGELSKRYQDGEHDLREHLEHEEAEKRARMETAARARKENERQATAGTLRNLLGGYVKHLERQGKQSAQDVRNIFKRNVIDEFPHLAEMRAADITHRDISAILARLIDRGAGRTAAKLRSYMRAAFAEALAAEGEPTAHPDLHGFNLTANPAALVPAKKLSAFNRARERTLNESEMRTFLRALEKQSGTARDAILLALLLGGQRSAQLVRLKPGDVDMEAREITLYDGKGARANPRVHRLPLTDRAAEIVARMLDLNGDKPYLITLNGKVHVRTETLSAVVTDICAAMMAKKTAREPFEMRDLRRTCETMLARMGISKETRAHILSHGLGGVQARHYDHYDRADEKRQALEAWDAKLAEIASGTHRENVVPIRAEGKT